MKRNLHQEIEYFIFNFPTEEGNTVSARVHIILFQSTWQKRAGHIPLQDDRQVEVSVEKVDN